MSGASGGERPLYMLAAAPLTTGLPRYSYRDYCEQALYPVPIVTRRNHTQLRRYGYTVGLHRARA